MIHLLRGTALEGELPSPGRTGINPLFKGRIRVQDQSRRCFIKPVPDYIAVNGTLRANREILNETIGYVLARSCGLGIPDTAGVIMLEREEIPFHVLQRIDSDTAGKPQDEFLAWFSEDMCSPDLVAQNTTGIHSQDLKQRLWARISRDLVKRKELPSIASFDEWTLNTDRNPGNLLSTNAHTLSLIDHGRIFTCNWWQPEVIPLLSRCICNNNQMLAWAEVAEPGWSQRLPIKSQRAAAYDEFNKAYLSSGHGAVRDALSSLSLPGDQIENILDCLSQRLEPEHYRKAIGLTA